MKLACLISARNLGDAALHSSVLAELAARRFADSFLVWTRPQMAFLFDTIPHCEVVSSPFPLGTGQQFRVRDWLRLWSAAREVRRRRPEVTIDLVGDARERMLAWVGGSRRHLYIGWERGHPFTHLIRNPLGAGRPAFTVPLEVPNVYEAYDRFVDALCQSSAQSSGAPPISVRRKSENGTIPLTVGLHPFASQVSKLWSDESWRQLAGDLSARGFVLTAFCAPDERPRLEQVFGSQTPLLRVVAGSLRQFETACRSLDLMIGLDSFSVHMAQRQGVPSIMLNAGNPQILWASPAGLVVGDGGGCLHHPCYNVPQCTGQAQFVCVRSIGVAEVLRAVDTLLSTKRKEQR